MSKNHEDRNVKITVWQFERGNQGSNVNLGHIRATVYSTLNYWPYGNGCCSYELRYEVVKWVYVNCKAYVIQRRADDPFAINAARRMKNCIVLDSDVPITDHYDIKAG